MFEDVNYGGGAGRNWATASASGGSARPGARVELFDATGTYVTFQNTNASGNYSFAGLAAGSYTVRVVSSSVSSSRTGYVAGLPPVLTFRTDASTGTAVGVTNHVGGHDPATADAGNAAAGWILNPATGVFSGSGSGKAHAFAPVTTTALNTTGVDFGFNFDTIVNVNNAGQGSLRQFLTNANTLGGDAALLQSGHPAGIESALFMISNGTAAPGLRATNNYFVGGVATISPTAALPTISTPLILNAQLQPGWTSPAPVIRIDGLSAGGVTGLLLSGTSDGGTIRGLMITRFSSFGIRVQSGGNSITIAGNWIGTTGTFSTGIGNGNNGIDLRGSLAVIGGTDPEDRNVITNNGNEGLNIVGSGATSHVIQGNYIGVDPDGSSGNGNADVGIAIISGTGNTIGGALPTQRNVISRNFEGIEINTNNNTVRGNYIGTDVGGTGNRGNRSDDGVEIQGSATGNRVEGNVIAFNALDGVHVRNGSGNPVLGNSIWGNVGIGIDLNNNGVTANDGVKTGGQANLLMDHPVFTGNALSGTNLSVVGYVGTAPGQSTFANARVEVFESDDDGSGFGQGRTYLGFLTTDANGNFLGTIDVTGKGLVVGEKITGTATDLSNNTSEFGANAIVTLATAVTLVSLEARALDGGVELSWQTGSEVDNLGFHLYRSTSPSGPWERITTSLIPGLGSSPEGARYAYRDLGLENGVTYFYLLEDVETTGTTKRHGPVSATPQAGEGEETEEEEGEDPTEPDDPPTSWITYGDPEATTLRVLERGRRHAVVELQTGGFYALPDEDGGVWLQVPGFVDADEPGAPALPVSRSWLEAVGGRKVKLVSVRGHDVEAFSGLQPTVTGAPELWEEPDGTLHAGQRRKRPGKAFQGPGLYPEQAAQLLGVAFQGDVKKAQLELSPLRWDRSGGRLLLARRLVVRVSFAGREKDELAFGGSKGRKKRGKKGKLPDGVVARLATQQSGLYAVGFEELFGSRGKKVSVSDLRLSRQGEAVAFHVEPAKRRFGRGSMLYFVSVGAAQNPYGHEAVYELSRQDGGVAMPVTSASPGSGGIQYYWQLLEQEQNRSYLPTLLSAPDKWLWAAVSSHKTVSYTLEVSGLAVAGEPGRLQVWLQGGSDYPVAPDHHVQMSLNGHLVGEASWDGKQPYELQADVWPGVLHDGENLLEIHNLGDTEAANSLVLLDRFALRYPRRLLATAGVLEGRFSQFGAAEIVGLAAGALVVDTTESPERWLTGAQSTSLGVSFRAEAGRSYLAVSPESVLHPEVRPADSSSLRSTSNRADYVVLGPRAFLPAAEPLLDQRRSQGLETLAVAIEEVYDVFGHGETRPEALREFLGHAYHEWRLAPRYVVLLGDATYDFKDNQGTGVVNQVPPYMIQDTYMWTVSDPTYAAVNGDDLLPDLALGRLPAQTLDEAHALVQKVLAWENAGFSLPDRSVLVADNSDHAGDFEGDAERVATTLLAGHDPERIYLGQLGAAVTRTRIQEAFDAGASLMTYMGHGAIALWASENVLSLAGVDTLSLQEQQPVLLTMNCLNGYFHFPFLNSLSEDLLKADGKGAIAAFSPSSMSVQWAANLYHEALVAEIASGRHDRLGDAILAAQLSYADSGARPELLAIYQLLGDPALKIH